MVPCRGHDLCKVACPCKVLNCCIVLVSYFLVTSGRTFEMFRIEVESARQRVIWQDAVAQGVSREEQDVIAQTDSDGPMWGLAETPWKAAEAIVQLLLVEPSYLNRWRRFCISIVIATQSGDS